MSTSVFYMPCVNFIGAGALGQAADKMKSFGFKKALLVTDAGIEKAGLIAGVVEMLGACGITTVVYTDTKPNPTVANVEKGLEILNKEKCDSIISLGGGSPQDCAKGIALVKTNGGKINDYEGADQASKPQFPLIAINTTAGTASEMTRFAVITDEERHVKMVIATDCITPLMAVNDANLMVKQPASLTAATGMDALTHAVEAYVSIGNGPITDACALKAITMISQSLRAAVKDGTDIEAREAMAYAEFMAGMAFNSAGLGYVHACAHQMGGMYDLPHGVCNAILLPHVEEFNAKVCAPRLRDVAQAMGVVTTGMNDDQAAEACLVAIRQLSKDVGIPSGFKELGAKEKDIPELAKNAMKDVTASFNPREATHEEVMQIYRNAM